MRWLLLVLGRAARARQAAQAPSEERAHRRPRARPTAAPRTSCSRCWLAATLLAVGLRGRLRARRHRPPDAAARHRARRLRSRCSPRRSIVVGKRLVVDRGARGGLPRASTATSSRRSRRSSRRAASRFTRKRLLARGGRRRGDRARRGAALTPALSLGPLLDTERALRDALAARPAPRRRRRHARCARPTIQPRPSTRAFPEGADRTRSARRSIVVRLDPRRCSCRPSARGWAPGGILAFSKICTHAGCAISLYRKPTFTPDAAAAGARLPLPLLDLRPGARRQGDLRAGGTAASAAPAGCRRGGTLRAGGNYSGPVGPSWSGVRGEGPDAEAAQRGPVRWTGAAAPRRCCARRCATCSPTTGRSCSGRSRCTPSSCSSRPAST